ncbi:hypothetical protein BG005_003279, partial [Podila minutissima]
NDFAHNISGFGLENNLKILKPIPNAQFLSTGELLEQYCQIMEGKNKVKKVSVDQCLDNHFDLAEDIFLMQYQDLLSDPDLMAPLTWAE